ncbi:MAG TPA: nucleotide disphospho-sugar-binding domain-containing protein [Gammaproteobacteria bacterium]
MARILFCWELGAGRGHITPHLGVARRLRELGHRVTFALRSLEHAETLLGTQGFDYLQAPTRLHACPCPIKPVQSPAQILHNVGYYDPAILLGRVKAWLGLFALAAPALVVCDHAPSALLAARVRGLPRAVVGNGFIVPPRAVPLPALDGSAVGGGDRDEKRVLAVINAALGQLDSPPLGALHELFDAGLTALQTYPEFDPHAPRTQARYFPPDSCPPGAAPEWPGAAPQRVFGYLYPGPYLEPLSAALRQLEASTLLVGNGIADDATRALSGPNLRFAAAPLDLQRVRAECRLGICNGQHATVANLLRGGCPLLLVPQMLEQQVLAQRVVALGAGEFLASGDPAGIAAQLRRLLGDGPHREAAAAFAARHAEVDAAAAEGELAAALDALASA